MPSLQERRNEVDMVQTYKIVMGVDAVNSEQWFQRADSRRPTRNNVVRQISPRVQKTIFQLESGGQMEQPANRGDRGLNPEPL